MEKIDLQTMLENLQDGCFGAEYYCHPENLVLLKQNLKNEGKSTEYTYGMHYESLLASGWAYGIDIKSNATLPKFKQRWEFPATPFVEYSKSDEAWAIPLRFGKWVDTTERVFFRINRIYGLTSFTNYPIMNTKKFILSSI